MKNKKIIFTGGSGRFGSVLKKNKTKYKVFFPTKKQLDITNYKKSFNYIKKIKPKFLIHAAALSRPMSIHDKNINNSIDINIMGTCNIVKICSKFKIKLIFFSTNYVYPSKSGTYKENDALLPRNTYAWSKLGAESAVQMYKNSLILRICMTEKPFVHKKAFTDAFTNFIYHEDLVKIFLKLINKKGVINIGGPTQSVYNFVKKDNDKIKKISVKNNKSLKFPINSSMSLDKLKKAISNKK